MAAIFSFTVFVSPVKAQEPLLVDPDAKRNASTVTTMVTNIDFTQAANNTAVTLVSFEGQAPKLQLIESQGKVSLTLPNTKLGEDQLVELNVADFGTLVSTIETFEDKDGARIEVNYSGPVTVQNTVKDGVIRMAITPMDSAQQDALEAEKKYTGDPISLDFQDVPVRQVLQIIAQVNGFNLVTTDTVTGNVTISLSGVPWDQALDMILRVKGLDKRLEGNILLIAPAEELSARETQALQSKKQVSDLAPLHTVNIPVNYAKAAALATILKST
ncbi:MAG: secretin and TonB N-terminal domain-containing protein, partial [Pseudomonadota bacterium]|nr:secretin and TonB N-terminal domain-containing protein [Pseudomonadota bacterium]